MTETITGVLEENLLTMLVWNEQHAPTLAAILPPTILGDKMHQRIAEVAIDYVNRFHHPPKVHIKDLLERELRRPDANGKMYMQILDAMERLEKDLQPQYVITELDKFIRIRRFTIACEDALVALNVGDEAKAEDTIWRHSGVTSRHGEGTWLHDHNLDFMTIKDVDFFSSGIDALDKRGIRPERGTLTLFIAPRKAGKSWSCVNIGKAGIRYRHKVLHVTLENSETLTKRRYIQAFWSLTKRQVTSIDVPYFIHNSTTDEWEGTEYQTLTPMALTIDNQKEIARLLDQLQARPSLLIKQFPTGSLTPSQLNAFLDNLERQHKFKPDLLIVDSPDLMASDARNLRIERGRNLISLRGMAVDRDIALYATTQGNRPSADAKWVTSKMVAEDWSQAGTADTILTFCRTPQEKTRGLARILVDAARDEEDGFAVMMTQSYATGQFHLDSVPMHGAMSAEFDRMTSDVPATTESEEE